MAALGFKLCANEILNIMSDTDNNITMAIEMVQYFLESKDEAMLIHEFIEKSHMLWHHFKDSNEEYLIQLLPLLLRDIPKHYLNKALDWWKSNQDKIDPIKIQLWALLHELIRHCLRYIHLRRCPQEVDGVVKYTQEYFICISLREQFQVWNL